MRPTVFAGIIKRPGTRYSALVPNLAGLERAMAGGRHRDRGVRRGLRNFQPQEHQPEHRGVAREIQGGVRPRARGGPSRPWIPVDRVRVPVRRRSRSLERWSRSPSGCWRLGSSRWQSATRSASLIPGQVRHVLEDLLATSARRASSRCTSTTRAAQRSRTCSLRCPSASPRSTHRPAGSAAARTRRARRATWPPKI